MARKRGSPIRSKGQSRFRLIQAGSRLSHSHMRLLLTVRATQGGNHRPERTDGLTWTLGDVRPRDREGRACWGRAVHTQQRASWLFHLWEHTQRNKSRQMTCQGLAWFLQLWEFGRTKRTECRIDF